MYKIKLFLPVASNCYIPYIMLQIKNKRIMVLAPHTDDAEFGCGGTISKLLDLGNEVFCVAFSACMQSVLPQFQQDVLIKEVKQASEILGIKSSNLILYNYEVRTFSSHRQGILDKLIQLRKDISPDIVLFPSINDIHQDHHVVAVETIRAFKQSTLLSYEIIWNNLTFNSTCFSILNEKHVQKKIEALNVYQSQKHRNYCSPDFVVSLAKVRGVQIGQTYAECFDIIRFHF